MIGVFEKLKNKLGVFKDKPSISFNYKKELPEEEPVVTKEFIAPKVAFAEPPKAKPVEIVKPKPVVKAEPKADPKPAPKKVAKKVVAVEVVPKTIKEENIISYTGNKTLDVVLKDITDDIKYISFPERVDEDVVAELRTQGYTVETYKNEADRTAKIKKFKKDLADAVLHASMLITPVAE